MGSERPEDFATAASAPEADSASVQKRLAFALEAAEERFSVLFRESSDPVLLLAVDGEMLSTNRAFERLTGLTSAQLFLEERTWKDFVHSADLEALRQAIRRCSAANSSQTGEFRLRREDGVFMWFEFGLGLLHNERGEARGILAVARDIDRRKNTEVRLREQALLMQERNARAQECIANLKHFFARVGALPVDADAFVLGIGQILCDMYRPRLVELRLSGDEPRVLRIPAEAEAPDLSVPCRICEQMLASGLPFYSDALEAGEYADDPYVRELGLKTFLGAPLRDTKGTLRGSIAILDVTARNFDSMDVELVTVAALHVAARLRAEEQEKARRELEEHLRRAQKMEAIGLLAGGIAHDFNNILSGILGFSSYLLSKVDEGTDLHRDLGLIEQSAVRAAELTRQLLAFTRRKHFAREAVSLNKVVEEVLGLLSRSLPKQIEIVRQLDARLPNVLGDSGQLNQVVMNLCLNAADAMAERGGRLTVATECRALTPREAALVPAGDSRPCVCLRIEDTGVGMTPEEQEHIFDPFFTTKAARGGSGLGLAIVYGIITNHDGEVLVDSARGRGSTFTVYLPAHHGAVRTEAGGVQAGSLRGTETVLIVDDEAIVRQMATQVLKGYGYQVVTASGGEEAVELLKDLKGRVDVALLDMVMPGMDGETTFHALRGIEPGLRVVLTSGFVNESRTRRLMNLGAHGMVYKPYKSAALLAKIREALAPPPAP